MLEVLGIHQLFLTKCAAWDSTGLLSMCWSTALFHQERLFTTPGKHMECYGYLWINSCKYHLQGRCTSIYQRLFCVLTHAPWPMHVISNMYPIFECLEMETQTYRINSFPPKNKIYIADAVGDGFSVGLQYRLAPVGCFEGDLKGWFISPLCGDLGDSLFLLYHRQWDSASLIGDLL